MINFIKLKYNSFHNWYTSLWTPIPKPMPTSMASTVNENEPSIAALTNTFKDINNMTNILIDSTELGKASRTIVEQMLRLIDLKVY